MLACALLLLAAAPDLTLHPTLHSTPPPASNPDAGAPPGRRSEPDVKAIFQVGHEHQNGSGREYKLNKRSDGSYVYDDDLRFVARIAPDGVVSFSDKPMLQLRQPNILGLPATSWLRGGFQKQLRALERGEGPDPATGQSPYHGNAANERDRNCVNGRLGCWLPPMLSGGTGADATDMAMRAAGQDPYRYEKVKFLEATAELRIQLAVEQRRKLLKQALDVLPARLDELWSDERWTSDERQRIVEQLLREIDRSDPAGQRAAEIIERWLQKKKAARSAGASGPP